MMKGILAVLVLSQFLAIAAPAAKKLAVIRAVFSDMEDGAPTAKDDTFAPGESIFFRCNIDGFQRTEKNAIHVSYTVEAQDAQGVLLLEPSKGAEETTLSPEDKEWMPKVRYTVVVPPLAPSGEYAVIVKVMDHLNNTLADARVPFLVKGRDVAPSDTLTVRNFRFLRSEDDDKALSVAAYRPGDAVWARFDMTGYKIGDHNEFDIAYGLDVLRSDGSVAYSEEQAATAKEAPFYPARFQPGELNLTLPKDLPVGAYTIVLKVHDNLGGQAFETRQKFSVE
jgi:hypothetical protein